MGVNTSTGFEQVRPTQDEKDAWAAKYPRRYPPYRSRCMRCGTRIWHSGMAVGSHRRACLGTFDERVLWFHYHGRLADREARIKRDPAAWDAYTVWSKATPDHVNVAPRIARHQIIAMIADGKIEVPS